jgi:hypothetical protein
MESASMLLHSRRNKEEEEREREVDIYLPFQEESLQIDCS